MDGVDVMQRMPNIKRNMNRKHFYHIQKNMFKNEMKLMKCKTASIEFIRAKRMMV